jgi:D-sedoheptulose 7-phosphate isomerase
MDDIILKILEDSISLKNEFIKSNLERIRHGVDVMAACLKSGNKILLFGNGGSAADAQHMAAEFVNRFQMERPPLAAIALTTDTSIITSIGNDYHFDDIFSKQVQALGSPGDIAVGISTSGSSKNVIKAMTAAKEIGMFTIGLTGKGGRLAELSDLAFCVNSEKTARIQEVHVTLEHILCDLVEKMLFGKETYVA